MERKTLGKTGRTIPLRVTRTAARLSVCPSVCVVSRFMMERERNGGDGYKEIFLSPEVERVRNQSENVSTTFYWLKPNGIMNQEYKRTISLLVNERANSLVMMCTCGQVINVCL